jgi:hypothetical protein
MSWTIAADLVVAVHLLWILFLIFGALAGRRVAWVKWLHVGALAFSVALQVFRWSCPLTLLEVWLRNRALPEQGYAGDFLAHYAQELVYLAVPAPVVFGGTLVIVAASWYAYRPSADSASQPANRRTSASESS